MSVDVGIELELFEAEDIAMACEHQDHGGSSRWSSTHADGNEQYIKVIAPCGHGVGTIYIVCWAWIESCRGQVGLACPVCSDLQPFDVANKVIGPVKDHIQ